MFPTATIVWCLYILVPFSTALAIVYYFSTSTLDKWEKLRVPYVRPVVPLFGNFLPIALGLTNNIHFYRRMYDQLAGHKYGGLYQMRTPYLMIRDPELVNNVFIKHNSHFSDRGVYSDFQVNPLSDHLFFMDNPRWKVIRSKLSPAFTSGKLKVMFEQIKQCGKVLMENIDEDLSNGEDELEIRELLGRYSTDVIGTCAFGLRLNTVSKKDSPFYRAGKTFFTPSITFFFKELCLMISPVILNILKIQDFPAESVNFFESAFQSTLKYREDENIVRNDFVNALMQARKDLVLNEDLPKEERFTETQIIANAILMFNAGYETISTSLSFCLYELALKKKIQDKVRSHIQLQIAKHGGKIDYELLLDLSYLDMVIAETIRKHPVFYALFRKATQIYQFPDKSLTIEKGQNVILPVQSLHFDPKFYPDPEVFDPERFSPEEKAKRISGTYFPFGDGPRMCIGKRFAELEMRLALVEFLTKFEVEPCERTQIPLSYSKMSMLVCPENGIWLKLKRITEN